jgi:O-acetylserine/cysteine efflux transporter
MFAFTVWSSLVSPAPLLLLWLVVDGMRPLMALAHPGWPLVFVVLVLSYAGTIFGFGVWARLLAHHPLATVAPFALLVPVVGMIAAALIFGEPLTSVELFGGLLVMIGLALNVFGARAAGWRAALSRGFHARHQGDPGQS